LFNAASSEKLYLEHADIYFVYSYFIQTGLNMAVKTN